MPYILPILVLFALIFFAPAILITLAAVSALVVGLLGGAEEQGTGWSSATPPPDVPEGEAPVTSRVPRRVLGVVETGILVSVPALVVSVLSGYAHVIAASPVLAIASWSLGGSAIAVVVGSSMLRHRSERQWGKIARAVDVARFFGTASLLALGGGMSEGRAFGSTLHDVLTQHTPAEHTLAQHTLRDALAQHATLAGLADLVWWPWILLSTLGCLWASATVRSTIERYAIGKDPAQVDAARDRKPRARE